MTKRWRNNRVTAYRIVVLSGGLALWAAMSYSLTRADARSEPGKVEATLTLQQEIDPEKVVGREACAECHKSEHEAWLASSHNKLSWELLTHSNAAKFTEKLGIADARTSPLCTSCHGTPQMKDGQLHVAHGNSCESCHGAAGGADGWFKAHSDFGLGGTTMAELMKQRPNEDPAHRGQRLASCAQAGMNGSENLLAIAKNCLQCHTVPHEELVNAGHPTSDKFEFVEWSQGEVRHNFLLDATKNNEAPSGWLDRSESRNVEGRQKLMMIAGQLADLEVSLRTRAQVKEVKRKTLGDATNKRIRNAIKEIEKLEIDGLKPVLDAVSGVDRKSLRELGDDDQQKYSQLADQVQAAALAFLKQHPDGADLPEIRLPSKVKGDAYTPQ